jgi:hypothetical protein
VSKRVIARLYLPLEMGAVGRITIAIAREHPDAVVAYGAEGEFAISADPDLSPSERRRIARERNQRVAS